VILERENESQEPEAAEDVSRFSGSSLSLRGFAHKVGGAGHSPPFEGGVDAKRTGWLVQPPIIPRLENNHPVCASRSLPLLQKEGIFELFN
jgi:hypothetical protein